MNKKPKRREIRKLTIEDELEELRDDLEDMKNDIEDLPKDFKVECDKFEKRIDDLETKINNKPDSLKFKRAYLENPKYENETFSCYLIIETADGLYQEIRIEKICYIDDWKCQ